VTDHLCETLAAIHQVDALEQRTNRLGALRFGAICIHAGGPHATELAVEVGSAWILAVISGIEQDLMQDILVAIVDLMEDAVGTVGLRDWVGVEPVLVHIGVEVLAKAAFATIATLVLCFWCSARGQDKKGQGDGGTQGELHGPRF